MPPLRAMLALHPSLQHIPRCLLCALHAAVEFFASWTPPKRPAPAFGINAAECIVLGLTNPYTGQYQLNPPPDHVVAPGDELIMLHSER